MHVSWQLRPDVEMIEDVREDGSPSLLVHDPVGETFDRVLWPESDIVRLLRKPRTAAELAAAFPTRCTLRPAASDIAGYLDRLAGKGWMRGSASWPGRCAPPRKKGAAALCAHLLFFQIPLLRPERFLKATAGVAGAIMNRFALTAFFLAGVAGVCLALPRWEEFRAAVLSGATLAGAPGFLAALAAVKTAHELAHAYTATRLGARVRQMGVALFFLMPLPFTDVTDGWRLGWPDRLRVAAAGLAAEMAVGASALFLWALAPPGEAAALLARLATVTAASTLATNLNPGPRFDGYFLLVCLTRTENLRARGVNALRALLLRVFCGVPGAGDAEEAGAGGRSGFGKKACLHAYAAYAVFYRAALGAAFVALAYGMLPKAFGIPAACLVASLFFLAPAAREIRLFRRKRAAMRFTPGLLLLLLLLFGGAVWFFGRWPRSLAFPAVSRAETEETVRARRGGIVRDVFAVRGGGVEAGQALAVLDAPAENSRLERAEWALREAEIALDQSWTNTLSRRDSPSREAERKRRADELAALRAQSELLTVESPAAGVLAAWDESIVPGVAVREGAAVGRVAGGGARRLACYPDVETAGRFDAGAEAYFLPDSGGPWLRGVVAAVGGTVVGGVDDQELVPALGAVRGGGEWRIPGMPRVRVVVLLDEPVDRVGQTGVVRVRSRPESLARRAAAWLRTLAVRESAF